MNGAESLIRTLLAGGVDTCFTNPGTSEMHIVAALDRLPEMRCVLGLFEGVVTGAADGYARMAEKPACTLLHLGPGFANGMANLHNARRAQIPMVNLIGQQATYHLRHDTPLTSDIEGIARPYSAWLRTSCLPAKLGQDAADALGAARTTPGRISTLIIPADVAWSEGGIVAAAPTIEESPVPPNQAVDEAAAILRSGSKAAVLLAGNALYGEGLQTAGRIANGTKTKLLAPYPFTRMERGSGRPVVKRIPYILEQAADLLREFNHLILVGATPPVAYFAAPGKNSVLTPPECEIFTLAKPGEDCVGALEALEEALAITEGQPGGDKPTRPPIPGGELTLAGLPNAIAAVLPEHAIIVDESMTSGRGIMPATESSPVHDFLANTGGSIGIAMPLAVGAAVACSDRPVLCLSADGSGMYTAQALWTMARENLRIITIIFANRAYGVLKREFSYLGVGEPGSAARNLFDIGHPDIDWVSLAKGMGVPGVRPRSLPEFAKALEDGFASEGPILIEVSV
jgi:acetolactate synthase I/II/III large subunit